MTNASRYQAVTRAFLKTRPNSSDPESHYALWASIVKEVAREFQLDNPKHFDVERFCRESGLTDRSP